MVFDFPESISLLNLKFFVPFPLIGNGRVSVTSIRFGSTGTTISSPSANSPEVAFTRHTTAINAFGDHDIPVENCALAFFNGEIPAY